MRSLRADGGQSPCGDVETCLVNFVFHITSAVAALVSQHFGQNTLEGVGIGVA